MRQFAKEHKKGFTFNFLLINRLLNYVFISVGLVGLIYAVNTLPLTSFQDFLNLIQFSEKLEVIKQWIHFEDIERGILSALEWLLSLYERIFGGMTT
jgi:hypothetical protein